MKIFITGASGFIGTELLRQLQNTGHELFCLVRPSSPKFDIIKAAGVNLIEGDLGDKAIIKQGMEGCDWVIHLAGLYSFWQANNDLFHQTNVEGTRNVMECALENQVSKVVHISTFATFGTPKDVPFTETSQVGPRLYSRYATTKAEGGKIAWDMYKRFDLPLVVVYPSVVLGPGNLKTSGLYVSDFVNQRMPAQVFTDKAFTWVHVRDVARGIIRALEKPGNIGEKYIIGDEVITLGDFNKMISEISGVAVPKMTMPSWLAKASARLFTGISRLTKKEPPLRMYYEQVLTMSKGIHADGSKAKRELNLSYTPVRVALQEEISGKEVQSVEMV
jgi:dihydroflavonol-4-reductase